MHEGVLAYLAWKNKEPPLYASQNEMPPETSLVFRFCCNFEIAAQKSDAELQRALSIARKDTETLQKQLNPQGSGYDEELTVARLLA